MYFQLFVPKQRNWKESWRNYGQWFFNCIIFLHVHTNTLQSNHIKIEQHCMEWPLLLPLWLSCPIHKKNPLSNLPTNFSFRSFSILVAYIYSCHKPTIYILKQLLIQNLINYIQRLNFQYCLKILFLSVQEEGKASREKLLEFEHLIWEEYLHFSLVSTH